jgi:uncharacterized Zn finger protein
MGALVPLAEERLAYLEEQITEKIPEPILTRGWNYFRENKVSVTEVMEGNSVYGAVNGSHVYAVVLDTDDFSFSTCNCPYNGYCKHMVAVFYQYCYTTGEDVEIVRLKTLGQIRKGFSQAVQSGEQLPDEQAGPLVWRKWFEAAYGEMWKQCRHSLHPLQPVLSRLKGTAKSWPKIRQRLHWLHVLTFVLEQVEKAYAATDSYNRYYYEMSFTRSVDPWIAHFQELALDIDPEMSGMEREWAESLNDLLLSLSLSDHYTLLRWDYMYHVVAQRLSSEGGWRDKERITLERLSEDPAMSLRQRTVIFAALAQLDFCEGNDAAAVEWLRQADFDRISQATYAFAQQRLEEGRMEPLSLWMAFLDERLADCRNSHILKPFLSLCRKADVLQTGNAKWTNTMISYLPHSYSELSAHWLERAQFTAWCNLQLLMGMRPDELDIQDIRAATKAAPEELLPLYHQAIDESVQTRNRQGYRTAVKLMKKLEKCYKATGNSDRWNRYVEQFSKKYHRLRALQEELWRGKIIK